MEYREVEDDKYLDRVGQLPGIYSQISFTDKGGVSMSKAGLVVTSRPRMERC